MTKDYTRKTQLFGEFGESESRSPNWPGLACDLRQFSGIQIGVRLEAGGTADRLTDWPVKVWPLRSDGLPSDQMAHGSGRDVRIIDDLHANYSSRRYIVSGRRGVPKQLSSGI
jgi:hypothetical protein